MADFPLCHVTRFGKFGVITISTLHIDLIYSEFIYIL